MKRPILSAILLFITAIAAQAQNITVHGTVISATDSEPLIGASVIPSIKGIAGTATDIDGNFEIIVPEDCDLTISYVGFQSKTVKAQEQLQVILAENSELLDEVVVVGYSSEKNRTLPAPYR